MLKQYLITFLISMVPLIELRGALPYALANGIPTLNAYIVCMVGNMLPVPLISGAFIRASGIHFRACSTQKPAERSSFSTEA